MYIIPIYNVCLQRTYVVYAAYIMLYTTLYGNVDAGLLTHAFGPGSCLFELAVPNELKSNL